MVCVLIRIASSKNRLFVISAILMSTHNITFSIKRKSLEIIPNIITSAAVGFFSKGTQERVRKSRGILAIRVQATEVLL